jgi:CheY-like chemotaxis protein
MPSGGTLTIKTANVTLRDNVNPKAEPAPGDYVLLTVTDTGTGIPPEIQPKIFEPFFTTKEVGEATGLGLSTCFGIIKQNKGHISFESTLNSGTTFKVFLPKAAKRKKSNTYLTTIRQGGTMDNATSTILLVEDSAVIRNMAARILKKYNYAVIEASNGEEALEIIKQQSNSPPHLLITDVTMPKLSGDKLAKQVKMLNPSIKILLMSGHTGRSLEKQGVLNVGYAILTKPFTPDLLIEKVSNLLAEGQNAP